ncbi:hypothetical protein IEO21_07853 [Rhodonia placenta]|uniref:Tubulin-specific chaperone D n=1 Tax=Rhodonia placenta TaxID=104341 RepID=A0A8H7NXD7_9APHY|nr:hypothetical protein IEO21_07853 [Postia placenta]
MEDVDSSEDRLFATFDKYQEFLDTQRMLLSYDILEEPGAEADREESILLNKLIGTLNEYQEQAYLLDPFLEQIVTPVVEALKRHARALIEDRSTDVKGTRVSRVAQLLYTYIKCGLTSSPSAKFFPHEIADLSIVLEYISSPRSPSQDPAQWSLRYVVLLWLSLICMIPFDLEQFDDRDQLGQTAIMMEALGKSYLAKAGLEREGASILLARFYMRKDTCVNFPAFLEWATSFMKSPTDPFPAIGILQVLCEIAKAGSAEQVSTHVATLLEVVNAVQESQSLMGNSLVRKLRTKLISRIALRLLPATFSAARTRGRALTAHHEVDSNKEHSAEEEIDVPEEVESILEELFKALQDKDTIVRWSAAKGVARISERLPAEFIEQVVDTVIGLFSIHSIAAASIYDLPSIAEVTWHGACLACAEIARRGLIADEKLPDLIGWLCKALYFDIRKGAHSIGSSVRDAACYVLWSLARAQRISALAPHAENLSRRLVAVSLFDREIHIRRAASATFQEYVGRTSLFAHGIDVLRKTDFYAVGIRRNAFLVAAREVAEHEAYMPFLIDHLLTITLRHWDPAMRLLGAQSLRAICELELLALGPKSAERASLFAMGPDTSDIHGSLLALTEISFAYREAERSFESECRKIFASLSQVPLNIIESPRHELVTAAACSLIASSISASEIDPEKTSVPHWRKIVDIGLKSRSTIVQEAAATAMAAVSRLVDCSADALLDGLTDYTSDERGDVGSWVRIACVKGLTTFAETMFGHARELPNFPEYFPASRYHDAVGGILKQGVERLDNVRQQAGECFLRLLRLQLPQVTHAEEWQIQGAENMKKFEGEITGWNDGETLFPKAVSLLEIERYREAILAGLVLSASTKTDSTQRPVTRSLVKYAQSLPLVATPSTRYDLCGLAKDLLAPAARNFSANNVVVPILQTFNVLLEADAFDPLPEQPSGLDSLRSLVRIASRNVARLKNLQRIMMSMRIVVNILPLEPLRAECVAQLPSFLTHQYPKVRADTAEHLYLVLQSKDLGFETDGIEEVLLETEWFVFRSLSNACPLTLILQDVERHIRPTRCDRNMYSATFRLSCMRKTGT